MNALILNNFYHFLRYTYTKYTLYKICEIKFKVKGIPNNPIIGFLSWTFLITQSAQTCGSRVRASSWVMGCKSFVLQGTHFLADKSKIKKKKLMIGTCYYETPKG